MATIDLEELENLLNQVAFASSKKEAEAHVRRLEFLASGVRSEVSGYTAGKLDQAIIHAKAASGQVKNKDHQLHIMRNAWYIFKSDIQDANPDTARGRVGPMQPSESTEKRLLFCRSSALSRTIFGLKPTG